MGILKFTEMPERGYVYVFESGAWGSEWKVGCTINIPSRKQELQSGVNTPIITCLVIPTADRFGLESHVHMGLDKMNNVSEGGTEFFVFANRGEAVGKVRKLANEFFDHPNAMAPNIDGDRYGVTIYRCCNIIFATEADRRYHLVLVHGDKHPCTIRHCTFVATSASKLERHINAHPRLDGKRAMKFLKLDSVLTLWPRRVEERKAKNAHNQKMRREQKKNLPPNTAALMDISDSD